MAKQEELLTELARCVEEMEDEAICKVAGDYVAANFSAYEGIMLGLAKGMEAAGALYEEGEYFIPELLICSDAMNNGIDILKPHLQADNSKENINVVIGVVEGDTHDIGKNLVKIMLEAAGFHVFDLGRDVPVADFVIKTQEVGAKIVCMSTLMTTTMDNMGKVIELLKESGLRDKVTVMVGGAPISQAFADRIGADLYTSNAAEAAKRAKELFACKDRVWD